MWFFWLLWGNRCIYVSVFLFSFLFCLVLRKYLPVERYLCFVKSSNQTCRKEPFFSAPPGALKQMLYKTFFLPACISYFKEEIKEKIKSWALFKQKQTKLFITCLNKRVAAIFIENLSFSCVQPDNCCPGYLWRGSSIREMDLCKSGDSFHFNSLHMQPKATAASCLCSRGCAEGSALSGPMSPDLCMSFISDCGVLTARNNRKMSKACYSSDVYYHRQWNICAPLTWHERSNPYELFRDAYDLTLHGP